MSADDEDWTLRHEFWYHCGTGGVAEIAEIVRLVAAGELPEGFESELREGSPYTVESLVNFQDEDGSTPGHAAAANNHVGVLQFLFHTHQAPWVVNHAGNSPLHWAAQNGCTEATAWLLDNIADIDVLQQNVFGKSAVSLGFESQNHRVLTAMLSHKSADAIEKPIHSNRDPNGQEESSTSAQEDEDSDHIPEFENISELLVWDDCDGSLEDDQAVKRTSLSPESVPQRVLVTTRELVTLQDLQNDVFDVEAGKDQTGCFVWESSVICALWMMRNFDNDPAWMCGKSVLEIGAGCGLPLMSVAKRVALLDPALRPIQMIASDFAKTTLANLQKNVELNNLKPSVEIKSLNWLDESTWATSTTTPSIFIGSDLIYDELLVEGFLRFLQVGLNAHPENCLYLTLEEHRAGVQSLLARLRWDFLVTEEVIPADMRQRAMQVVQSQSSQQTEAPRFSELESGIYYMLRVRSVS
eukprot:Gregarina_sp_Pseudo_9__3002@NODE_320_length_3167_cov_48_432545_g300_i0_p2_GENE_NODE_320_length_3167_cov_48_432545_g300_i0NODE_320_length_3167_cov_48_432545_g300_i0_p2_ORF_typecomplete_len469_score75_30Methyltransf_16/PF10294_9/1_9e24Ank_2/PF12796_7/1_9e14Ank_2/PF12796_7/1_3e03Ank_5/PF13857_6/0_00058Ank_5/PF13857_6/1_5e07Ank_4/PF13637_6/0_00021Ank_4/PF13637_6/2_2e05Ank_3/PF13606_6/22Ank_3/PF13606_6/6_4e06Ank/PF00023_30/14Ank/PF00023_30/0_00024MTS/PF05175_14/2_4e05Methyltransf_31/PF13847_6/0_00084